MFARFTAQPCKIRDLDRLTIFQNSRPGAVDYARAGCRHPHPCQEKPCRHQTGRLCRLDGIKDKDGKIHAIEARIFPKATPDGGRQFAWDLMPDSVMTNATVGTVTKAAQGAVLHVTFTGGESEYSIGPDVPILANAPGDMSLLKPGAAVFVIALKKPDGTVTAARLYAEKDGIKPPM